MWRNGDVVTNLSTAGIALVDAAEVADADFEKR
jgi:hypothetical protein